MKASAKHKKRAKPKSEAIAVRGQSVAPTVRRAPSSPALLPAVEAETATLALDLGRMIEVARQQVAHAANMALTTLYWELGTRVRMEVLRGRRAAYGAQIVSALGRQLEARHGRGFGEKNLRRMVQFAEVFPDSEIVAALLRELGWTHFTRLIPMKDPLKREFYAEMCRVERWSTRMLRQKIDGMLYERTTLSKKPEQLIRTELAALREGDVLYLLEPIPVLGASSLAPRDVLADGDNVVVVAGVGLEVRVEGELVAVVVELVA